MSEFTGVLGKLVKKTLSLNKERKSGKAGWIATAVAGLLTLVTVAILAFRAWKLGKQKAKLLHEQAVKEEELHQEKFEAEVEDDLEEVIQHMEKAKELSVELEYLEAEKQRLEVRKQVTEDTIDKIKSWEDVDETVN